MTTPELEYKTVPGGYAPAAVPAPDMPPVSDEAAPTSAPAESADEKPADEKTSTATRKTATTK